MQDLGITIRIANNLDLKQITEIYNWAVENTVATFDLENRTEEKANEWFLVHQNSYYPLVVAEKEGKILGWASISPFHPRPAYKASGEFSIYIAPRSQGLGIGKRLLEALCQMAEQLGYHTLLGLITGTNEVSLALAGKLGFEETGRYREVGQKFGQVLDVVVVQKVF
ncbi:GNAT family N-acetyltransferase [Desulfitobacterium metallireducens]|uniref:GNAT family acetyltransferase n=1 Tax=Desulfitobacterium metallireducens DSM 15288 TaxID=871968 RepID=W0EC16_9FIRM|nr:GNAT family N-acetyltransferase [Desulfitobacterium metallireducens]AHF06729.1 GNAT family acetyltransferase [Desulfitobacterium metallireducens DSM 15288]